jgi:hypothetical protein
VIFNDKFETVHSLHQPLDQQWATIFCLGRECFADVDYNDNGQPILPPMSDIIKSYQEKKEKQPCFKPVKIIGDQIEDPGHQSNIDTNNTPLEEIRKMPAPRGAFANASTDKTSIPGGETTNGGNGEDKLIQNSNRPRRNVGTYKQGPAKIQKFPINGESYDFSFVTNANKNSHRQTKYHPMQKISKASHVECYLLQHDWTDDYLSGLEANKILDSWESNEEHMISEVVNPRLIAAKICLI